MATAAGLGGPPVALVYQRANGLRLRGTLAAYFIVGTVMSLSALASAEIRRKELRLSEFRSQERCSAKSCRGERPRTRRRPYQGCGRPVSALAAVSVIVTVLL